MNTYNRVVLFFSLLNSVHTQTNPCSSYDYLHYSQYRGEACPLITHKPLCDYHIQTGWYRITGDAKILTHEPGLQKCATLYTIWMNGTLPTQSEGIVNRTACRTGIFSHCEDQIPIMVKNCSNFNVYHLHYPLNPSCDSAFCFGPNKDCPPEEPCDFYYHEELPAENIRDLSCGVEADTNYCDSNLVDGWYKLSPKLSITNTCPNEKSCGKDTSLWIDGGLPTLTDQIVNRTACVPSSSNCCEQSYQVQIKNCSEFLSYNLQSTTDCSERYCIGDGNGIECTTRSGSSSIHPGSTTSNSVLTTEKMKHTNCFGICGEKVLMISMTVGLMAVLMVTSGILLYSIKLRKRSRLMSTAPSLELVKTKC